MTTSLAAGMQSTPMSFDGQTAWGLNTTYTSTGAWSLSFWMMASPSTSEMFMISGGSVNPGTDQATVSVMTSGILHVVIANAVISTGPEFFSSVVVNNDIPHHVVVTSDGATIGGYHLYVDGVDVTTTLTGSVAVPLIIDTLGGFDFVLYFTGILQDLAVFNKQLSAAEVEGLYNRSHGYLQESSADRVTRLLDDAGWPAAWREITTNPRASVGELVYNAATVNSKLAEVQDSEQGRVFATKANYVAFRERYYANEVTAGAVVQQIFSDDNGATALPYSTFGFDWHEDDVANDVTVTTPTAWASESDAASITANGVQSRSVDTILTTFEDADMLAAGLVAEHKDPTWRVNPIMIYPENNTTRWDEVLGLELGYRVSMEITPMAVGAQNVQEVTLEQIEWSIVDGMWTLMIAGSPCFGTAGVAAEVGWFTIGTSLIGGPDVIGF